jgi:DNA-binding MarR family transcriptional regulator
VAKGKKPSMSSSINQPDLSMANKWGSQIVHLGWTSVPNALIRHMGALDISPAEMVVICYLIMFWWEKDRLPFPSIMKMAAEVGVSSKTIERKLDSLEKKMLIKKEERLGKSNQYDLSPLIRKLTEILKT